MTLEALRTKLDSLAWENSQLEIENKRLRESNPNQAALVDLEAELERSKEDTVHLTEQLGSLEKQLSAALQREEDLRRRVEAAQGQPEVPQPVGLEQMAKELEMAKRDAQEASSRAAESDDQATELTQSLAQETARVRELESELDHQRGIAMQLQQDAELHRYRTVEAETRKWEAREERLVEELARMREELRVAKTERQRLRDRGREVRWPWRTLRGGQLEKQGTGNGNGKRERERTTDGAQNGIDMM